MYQCESSDNSGRQIYVYPTGGFITVGNIYVLSIKVTIYKLSYT